MKTATTYDPAKLLDALLDKFKLKNDAALCRALQVAPPVISKMRHQVLPVGASMLLRIHEATGLSIKEIRVLIGDRRVKSRVGRSTYLQDAA